MSLASLEMKDYVKYASKNLWFINIPKQQLAQNFCKKKKELKTRGFI